MKGVRPLAHVTPGCGCGAARAPDGGFSAAEAEQAARDAVAAGMVKAWLQPVVCLRTGEVLGYEALARGPAGGPLHEPHALFPAAERAGCAPDLERLCRLKALEAKHHALGRGPLIFINVDPRVRHRQEGVRCADCEQIEALTGGRGEVVLEVTERVQMNNPALEWELEHYRARRFRIALDDVGMGHSGLAAMINLKPDYLKVDMFLVQGAERDPYRAALIRMLILYSLERGIALVAEGIDTPHRLAFLARLGVQYGQGFFLGRPAPVPGGVAPEALAVIRSVSGKRRRRRRVSAPE